MNALKIEATKKASIWTGLYTYKCYLKASPGSQRLERVREELFCIPFSAIFLWSLDITAVPRKQLKKERLEWYRLLAFGSIYLQPLSVRSTLDAGEPWLRPAMVNWDAQPDGLRFYWKIYRQLQTLYQKGGISILVMVTVCYCYHKLSTIRR